MQARPLVLSQGLETGLQLLKPTSCNPVQTCKQSQSFLVILRIELSVELAEREIEGMI